MSESTTDSSKRDLFVSYASEDREFARELVEALQARGITVWWDQYDVSVGDTLHRAISEGITRSKHAVAILSEHYFSKPWTRAELDALSDSEVEGNRRLFPVLCDISIQRVKEMDPVVARLVAVDQGGGCAAVVEQISRSLETPGTGVPTEARKDALRERWRWYSTPESAEAGQLSVLAIVETCIALSVYAGLAMMGFTFHIVSAICLAPLMLIRTEKSTNRALSWADRLLETKTMRFGGFHWVLLTGAILFIWFFWKLVDRDLIGYGWWGVVVVAGILLFGQAIFFILVAVLLIGLRILATAATFFQHPVRSIEAIPGNWWRLIGCTDSAHPPELLAGSHLRRENYPNVQNNRLLFVTSNLWDPRIGVEEFLGKEFALEKPGKPHPAYVLCVVVSYVLLLILPALLLRYSIKGSSIVYLPILWLVHSQKSTSIQERFDQVSRWAFEKFRLAVAALVIAVVATKIVFAKGWTEAGQRLYEIGDRRFIDAFIAPSGIPVWQWSAALNGVFVFILFFVADAYVKAGGTAKAAPVPRYVESGARALWVLSTLLSFYTIWVLVQTGVALHLGGH